MDPRWLGALLLLVQWRSFSAFAKNQSCQEFTCASGGAPTDGRVYCNSCSDCGRLKRNFCVQSTNRCECLNSIPYSCSPWEPNMTSQGERHTFCYVATTTLPAPRARHRGHSVDVVVDRFFDSDEYKPYAFSNLNLYAEFPVAQPSYCDDEILPTRLINDTRCLIFMRMHMPTIDFHGEPNDPFYYDDQTPMSISFSTDLLKTSQNVRFWYEVTATWTVHLARPKQAVMFMFHQYSQIAQLQLNEPVLEKITKRMDIEIETKNITAIIVANVSTETEEETASNSTATVGKLVQAVHNIIIGNFTQEAELLATMSSLDEAEIEAMRSHHLNTPVEPEQVEIPAPNATLQLPIARGLIKPSYNAPQALEHKQDESAATVHIWNVDEAGIHEVYQDYIEEHFYWWVALLVTLLCCSCLIVTFFFCVVRNSRHHEHGPPRLGNDLEHGPRTLLMGNR